MSPSVVTIDNRDDFESPSAKSSQNGFATRTLLLADPALSSQQDKLSSLLSAHNKSTTDLQMLDRLSAGLMSLPEATYDLILLLTISADGVRSELGSLLDRHVFAKIVPALKPGGILRAEDGSLREDSASSAAREAILAGLVGTADGFTKQEEAAVPLKLSFGKGKKMNAAGSSVTDSTSQPTSNGAGAKADIAAPAVKPAGVGFVDLSDDIDLDDMDDDDLMDEDTLLTEEDLNRPLVVPAECRPTVAKRRKACKDCTCGMKERLEAEDAARRANADYKLKDMATAVKLGVNDLNELDFTVKGKTGSCNNCALGDAFRCAGCPYIGLPAFKPGEEVRLLNEESPL